MFKSLFRGKSAVVPASKLPQAHSLIDVIVDGRSARQVMVDEVDAKGVVTKECLGRVGETAVLVYGAIAGRFRAETKIVSTTAQTTRFEIPRSTRLVGAATAPQKRSSMRMDTLAPGQWRFAPSGVGTGEFLRGTIRDISRGGCSLICERQLKLGTAVEVRIALRSGTSEPVTLLAEVMRHEHIAQSGKHSHGLRFQGIRPEEDQAIVEYINRKQADLRNRGLA